MLPDLTGRVAVITGAGTGIGFHTALELACRGAHVVLACHIEEQGKHAETKISEAVGGASIPGGKATNKHLDVSSLASDRTFAQEFIVEFDRLDMLINNAGIVAKEFTTTTEGFELEFATNYLGHFALVCRLMELLKRNSNQARILTVSSVLHKDAAPFHVDELMVGDAAKYNRIQVYAQRKLYVLLFTFELQRRLEARGISNVIAVGTHPGIASTNMMDTDLSDLGFKTYIAFKIASKLMQLQSLGRSPFSMLLQRPTSKVGITMAPMDFFLYVVARHKILRALLHSLSKTQAVVGQERGNGQGPVSSLRLYWI